MAVSTAPGRKRGALRSPVTWVIILGVTVGAGAWILWRRNQAANAAATGSSGSAGTDTAGTGNDAGALSTLQTEIADLQSSGTQAGPPPAGTGTGGAVTAPKAPPVITVINPGNGAADISWTGVPGATGYELDITGPNGSAQAAPKVNATHARVQLPPGKKNLRARVRGYNSAGSGPWSAPRAFNTGGSSVLRKPPGQKAA